MRLSNGRLNDTEPAEMRNHGLTAINPYNGNSQ